MLNNCDFHRFLLSLLLEYSFFVVLHVPKVKPGLNTHYPNKNVRQLIN